jgi:hypothetical protein
MCADDVCSEDVCSDDVCSRFMVEPDNIFFLKLKKHCSDSSNQQLFFNFFPIHTLVFEKMCADDVVRSDDVICSRLRLNTM